MFYYNSSCINVLKKDMNGRTRTATFTLSAMLFMSMITRDSCTFDKTKVLAVLFSGRACCTKFGLQSYNNVFILNTY